LVFSGLAEPLGLDPFGWVTGRRVHGGPFDVTHHANTSDRVLGIHIAGPSKPGQFNESWVDMLFVKGFDAGQPIVYLSTDAGQPLTAVLERLPTGPSRRTSPEGHRGRRWRPASPAGATFRCCSSRRVRA
jgi:hypothetical protein